MKTIRSIGRIAALSVLAASCEPTDTICEMGDSRCECGGGGKDCGGLAKILVTPDNVLKEFTIGVDEVYSVCYRARAIAKSGAGADITNASLWTLDRPEMGSFAGNCLTTAKNITAGGIVRVRATLGGATGEAALIIKLRGDYQGDSVTPEQFCGPPNTDPKAKPGLVYPLNDSIHARNIKQMNLQFFAGQGNQVFRARVTSSQMDYTAYFKPTKCDGDRCQWKVPEDVWSRIAVTNGGTSAKIVISGAGSGGSCAPVAQSDSIQLSFSPDGVQGGLYYFSTSLPGILRLTFDPKAAATKASPFVVPNSGSNPKECAGCHAVTQDCNEDGRRLAATYGHGDEYLGVASSVNASKFILPPGSVRSNFQWFSPDATKLISNYDGDLIVRNSNTGSEIGRVPRSEIGPEGKQKAAMPEWSHDGKHIVFVRLGPGSGTIYDASNFGKREGGDWLLTDAGEITTIAYEAGAFSNAKVVVALGEGKDFHYYPTFSPDDQWIIFNTGTKPGFSPVAQGPMGYGVPSDKLVSYDQKTSRLRMVKATGGGVIDLVKATVAAGSTASWPKFTPWVQKDGKLMFFTYSSKIDYGFVVTGGAQPQLWMSAVDLGKIGENSSDPSYAPAWLPFQDEREANHLGVWSTGICCDSKTDCGSEFDCLGGKCGCDPDKGCAK